MENSVIALFLPVGLLEHFKINEVKELGDVASRKLFYEIFLEENNDLLGDFDKSQYESKGFTEVTLQDFPIRGKAVFLKIKRRRWRHKERKNEIVKNDFSFVAEGAGFTRELSDFLKGTGRYTRRHDH